MFLRNMSINTLYKGDVDDDDDDDDNDNNNSNNNNNNNFVNPRTSEMEASLAPVPNCNQ